MSLSSLWSHGPPESLFDRNVGLETPARTLQAAKKTRGDIRNAALGKEVASSNRSRIKEELCGGQCRACFDPADL
jgi:hypothetical protein